MVRSQAIKPFFVWELCNIKMSCKRTDDEKCEHTRCIQPWSTQRDSDNIHCEICHIAPVGHSLSISIMKTTPPARQPTQKSLPKRPQHIVESRVYSHSQKRCNFAIQPRDFCAKTLCNFMKGVVYFTLSNNDSRPYNACPAATSGGVCVLPVDLSLDLDFTINLDFFKFEILQPEL